MKKMFKIRIFAVFCALAWATSCQKTDVETPIGPSELKYDRAEYEKNLVDASITDPYAVINGVLHFRDFNVFSETQERFQTLSELEKRRVFSEIGFSSYSHEFALVTERISEATSKEEYDRILSSNQDILEIATTGAIRPKAGEQSINDFMNRGGQLYIGKILYQFGKEYQKVAFDGMVSTLKGERDSRQLLISKTHFQANARSATSCQSLYTSREQNGDRRATAYTSVTPNWYITGYIGSQPVYRIQWALRLTGYPEKKNFWGNWVNYNTVNNLKAGFGFNVFSLNSYDPYGSRGTTLSISLSNEDSQITHDVWLVYDNITQNPSSFVNEHTFSLNDSQLGFYPNTYETRGVNTFTYGCL